MSLPLCVLALTVGTAIGAARGSCRCACALAVLAPVWILGNGALEGHVLWTLDSEHGLTTGDLLTIPMLVVAALRLWSSAEVRGWLAARAGASPRPGASAPDRQQATGPATEAAGAAHRGALDRLGTRSGATGPRSGVRLAGRGAAPSDRQVTTARGDSRHRTRTSALRLSTGGPGGAPGDRGRH